MTQRLVLTALMLACLSPLSAAVPGADFFTHESVHRFEIQLSEESLQALREEPREYVPATVRADGQIYTNVGVHLKGVATFRPVDGQPSLTLNFSKFVANQRFHGLRKIHLNNGKEDPTFLREAISAAMFAEAGVPTARVTLARVRMNERDLGPSVAIEGFTPEMLGRYFKDTKGNLYDSGFRQDITDPLERLMGKKPDDWKDLKELANAAQTSGLTQRWVQLARRLDTNSFARYLAMQVLTANWDGYATFKNNYRVYHDPTSDRLHFLPHGMDQTFVRAQSPLLPRWEGLVARAFMETREGRALYRQQIGLLFTNVYHTASLIRRVDELAAPVQRMLAEQSPEAAALHASQVAELRRNIEQRGKFIAQQLTTTNWMEPPRLNRVPQKTVPVRPATR